MHSCIELICFSDALGNSNMNEEKNKADNNELNEEDLEQVQGGLMRKPNVPDNSDEKEKPSVNPAEAGGPKIVVILQ